MVADGTHRKIRVATAQFYSHTDVTANVELSRKYIREAAEAGAKLIVLPENANRTRIDYKDRETAYELCEDLDGEYITALCQTAKELDIFIVAGVDLKTATAPNVHVAVVLIGDEGKVLYVHHKTVLVRRVQLDMIVVLTSYFIVGL
jgi:predicted amidohydrolase